MKDPSLVRKKKKLTITASEQGVEKAEKALIRLGIGSKSNFAKSRMLGRNTVTKFFNRQPIQLDTFKRICEELELNWKEIAGIPSEQEQEQEQASLISTLNGEKFISGIEKEGYKVISSSAVRTKVDVIDEENRIIAEITLQGNSINNLGLIQFIFQVYSGNTIKIIDIKSGSIKLFIEGSQEDIQKLQEQIESGKLEKVDDLPIKDIKILENSFLGNESNVEKWSLVREIRRQRAKARNLSGVDLSDADLSGVDLSDADLSGADLSGIDLSGADLSDADLRGSDLNDADLSEANITGAIIEPKSIPSTAIVNGLRCDYFYPKSNSKKRYPITGELTSSEAIKLLQKPSGLILIFEQKDGIDWSALFQAFNNCLREFNISPDNSNKIIQSFERISDDNFALRLNLPDRVDQIKFEQKIKQEYKKAIEDLKREYPGVYQTTSVELIDNTSKLKIIEEEFAQLKYIHIENIIKTADNNMPEHNNSTNLPNTKIGAGVISNPNTVTNSNIVGNINKYTSEQKQNLAEAAEEIQQLLQQLERTNSSETASEKAMVVTKAIDKIEKNPTLKKRIIGALNSGAKKALKEAVDHPLVNMLMAFIEGWQETK